MTNLFITSGEAAQLLGMSRAGVHYLAARGALREAARVGMNRARLFDRAEVEALAQEREK